MDQGVRLRPIYTAARGQILDGEDLVDHLSNDHAYPVDRLDAASDPALLRLHRVDHATGRADHHHGQDIASSVQEAAVEAIYRELREALTLALRAAVPAFEQAILTTLDDAVVNHLDQLAALVLASDPVTAPALRVTALPDGSCSCGCGSRTPPRTTSAPCTCWTSSVSPSWSVSAPTACMCASTATPRATGLAGAAGGGPGRWRVRVQP
jgi:hypothetical protein